MALTYRVALALFLLGLTAIASSQLLVKWRFGEIAAKLPPKPVLTDTALAVLSDKWLWAAALTIGLGVVCWYAAMVRLPLTLMLPVAGLVSPAVVLGAHFFLGEPLSAGQLAAVLMIASGVMLLGWLQ